MSRELRQFAAVGNYCGGAAPCPVEDYSAFLKTAPEQPAGILLIARFDEDLISLLRILDDVESNLYWHTTRAEAAGALKQHVISLVICDRALPDGTWEDVLRVLASRLDPPPLIVAERRPDARLKADVLNRGCYGVLAKPFDAPEVRRVLAGASQVREPVQDRKVINIRGF